MAGRAPDGPWCPQHSWHITRGPILGLGGLSLLLPTWPLGTSPSWCHCLSLPAATGVRIISPAQAGGRQESTVKWGPTSWGTSNNPERREAPATRSHKA